MNNQSVLTVTLNPALDRFLYLSDGSAKAKKFDREMLSAGGKGINVSRALKNLGVNTFATGILGGKVGRRIKVLLNKEKISHQFFCVKSETRLNTSIISAKNPMMRLMGVGPTLLKSELAGFSQVFNHLLPKRDVVVISGSTIEPSKYDLFPSLIQLAKMQNKIVAIDTSGLALKRSLRMSPTILRINLAEAESLLNKKLDTQAKLKGAVNSIHGQGVKIVLISLAEKGAFGSNKQEMYFIRPPKIKGILNDVGCGDAFLAGFLKSFLASESFLKNLCWAVAAGSANLKSQIPGKISIKDVATLNRKSSAQVRKG